MYKLQQTKLKPTGSSQSLSHHLARKQIWSILEITGNTSNAATHTCSTTHTYS